MKTGKGFYCWEDNASSTTNNEETETEITKTRALQEVKDDINRRLSMIYKLIEEHQIAFTPP